LTSRATSGNPSPVAGDGGSTLHSKQKKRPKSLVGRLLGMQSKELSLEKAALAYSKGKGKKPVYVPYEAIHLVQPIDKSVWAVQLWEHAVTPGLRQEYEFHAASQEERDKWVEAVKAKVEAAQAKLRGSARRT